MSGVWKRRYGRPTKAPPDERGGNRHGRPNTTAPHPDSTHCRHSTDTPRTIRGASSLWGAPFSTVWGIRGSCGGDVPIERRGRDAEAVRDLSHADVGIGEQRLGGLDVVVREFRRPASGAANAPRGGKARLGE